MKIGLVLGGGFARGAAQLGFLKGMFEAGFDRSEITLMSGSSIGGINALGVSLGKVDKLEELYRTLDIVSIGYLKKMLKNHFVKDLLDEIYTDEEKLQIPMYITGTCMSTVSTHYFYCGLDSEKEELDKKLNITVTFPFVNGVVRREFNKWYLDGGGTDNIPVYPFKYNEMDLVLILHCYPKYVPPHFMVYSNTVVIDVDIAARCSNGISTYSFDKKNLNEMIDIGYEYGKEFYNKVLCDRDLKAIKERGQQFIREEADIRKKKRVPLNAAVIFNKVQSSRKFE